MGNAPHSKLWTPEMYAKRDIILTDVMSEISFHPIIVLFDTKHLLSRLISATTAQEILDDTHFFALKSDNYVLNASADKKRSYKFIQHLTKRATDIEHGTWYHLIVQTGNYYFMPRLWLSMLNSASKSDEASMAGSPVEIQSILSSHAFHRVVVLLNSNKPVMQEFEKESLVHAYPLFFNGLLYFVITPHFITSASSFFEILGDSHSIKLFTPPGTSLKILQAQVCALLAKHLPFSKFIMRDFIKEDHTSS
jgi:hypothetical protein